MSAQCRLTRQQARGGACTERADAVKASAQAGRRVDTVAGSGAPLKTLEESEDGEDTQAQPHSGACDHPDKGTPGCGRVRRGGTGIIAAIPAAMKERAMCVVYGRALLPSCDDGATAWSAVSSCAAWRPPWSLDHMSAVTGPSVSGHRRQSDPPSIRQTELHECRAMRWAPGCALIMPCRGQRTEFSGTASARKATDDEMLAGRYRSL